MKNVWNMGGQPSNMVRLAWLTMRSDVRSSILLVILLFSSSLAGIGTPPSDNGFGEEGTTSSATARALIIWSGTMSINNDFTVEAGDELRIYAGTTVQLGPGVRVYIEGKVVAEGTTADPIVVQVQPGYTWHDGFQFNSSSRSRGSSLRNISFHDAQFGLTIFDSDPVIEDVVFDNVDLVAIDMFNSANPTIRRATFTDGGQDVHGSMTNWRYGIGLSVGAGSAPYVEDVTFTNQITRAISYWGDSGGVVRNITISEVGGATMNISAGIFVEDSIPLFEDINISKCDNGVYILHREENLTTRPVFRDMVIGDSQYNGVMMTKYNRWNFSTYMMGRFHNLEVYGTGGPNSSSPGFATGTVFLNTSGGWFENVDIHDNTVNGVKLYMTDPSTSFINTSIRTSGAALGGTNERAGLFSRSSMNGGPSLVNLTVSNSPGIGIFVSKGSVSGSGWTSRDNGQEGLRVLEMFPSVDGLVLEDNGFSGLRVSDSKQVWLSNLTSRHNGYSAPSADNGAGMVFVESNDLMSAGNIVHCSQCTSIDDNWAALRIEDSVDILFTDLAVHDPNTPAGQSAVIVDDSGLNWNGWVDFERAEIYANLSVGAPAILLNGVDARIERMNLYGNHSGIQWSGRNLDSKMGNSTLTGSDCLTLSDLPKLDTWGLDVTGCSGNLGISNSDVNLTDFLQGAVNLAITGASYVRAISSQVNIPPLPLQATLDEMWFVDMWVVNQHGHGLPYALLNGSFSQMEDPFSMNMPYSGNEVLGPFTGTRHTITGASSVTDYSSECWYDNTSGNAIPTALDQDLLMHLCTITLVNQPPLIIWDEPLNNTVVSSGSEIWFNASRSWDLDDDPITFQWTSDVDGNAYAFCSGFGNGVVPGDLLVNSEPPTQGTCALTDGDHQITLEVCDDQGNCASETRTITFVNLPPQVIIQTTPALDWDGVLRLNFTENLHVNASDTTDPEGDPIETQEWAGWETPNPPSTILEWNRTFAGSAQRAFTYTITFSDGLNPKVYYNLSVELQNEYPHPVFTVSRDSNLSSSEVLLDGSASFDPEGDTINAWWHSDVDGDLDTSLTTPLLWSGHLSPGIHTLSLRLGDDDSYHINQWSAPYELTIVVANSPPFAHIELPAVQDSYDSSDVILFSAFGSGDWDAPCAEAFAEMSVGWLCNPDGVAIPDTVVPIWTSDLLSEPIGGDWEVEARLPAGENVVTLTVSDGLNPPMSDSITLSVDESAPILVLTSPGDGLEVVSNEVILFDPQQSWDADGDIFTFTVTSDILTEPLLDEVSPNFWYSRYLPSGDHTLTFTVEDETGRSRNETRTLTVLASPPTAIISSPTEGGMISPGATILLDGNESWDADEDIVLYRWYLGVGADAQLLNETALANRTLPPGNHMLSLQVKDSRGASSWAFSNITVEPSWPVVDDILLEPGSLTAGQAATITARAIVVDADETTWECVGWASQGGVESEFILSDDGQSADGVAGDGTWSGQVSVTPGRDGWMNVEVICRDGPSDEPRLSNRLSTTIRVEGATQHSSIFDVVMESTLLIVVALFASLIALGLVFTFARKRRLAADLAMIETWGVGGFSPREDEGLFADSGIDSSISEMMGEGSETADADETRTAASQSDGIPEMPDLDG